VAVPTPQARHTCADRQRYRDADPAGRRCAEPNGSGAYAEAAHATELNVNRD